MIRMKLQLSSVTTFMLCIHLGLNVEISFIFDIIFAKCSSCIVSASNKRYSKIDHKIRTIEATVELRKNEKNDGLLFV